MPAPRPNAHARSTVVAATPMAFVQAIARAYALRQLAPDAALAAAQIAPADLDRTGARITALQMEWLSAAAMQELDDEGLGWFARPLPWGSYGMLARASLSAPTLGVALKRWCRHHGLLTRDITLAVQTEGDEARIVLSEHRPPGGDGSLREFCFVSVLRNIHGLACWFVDSRIPLLGASFPFAAPPHAQAYRVLEAEGLVEVRGRSGVYLAPQDELGGELLAETARWMNGVLVEAWKRRIGVRELPDLVRLCTSSRKTRVAVVESNSDQMTAYCTELEEDFGVESVPVRISPVGRKIPAVPLSRPSVMTFHAPAASSSRIHSTHRYGAMLTSESFEPTSDRTRKSRAKSSISSSFRSRGISTAPSEISTQEKRCSVSQRL